MPLKIPSLTMSSGERDKNRDFPEIDFVVPPPINHYVNVPDAEKSNESRTVCPPLFNHLNT
ncbi:Uncharacterised protein [Streptococcus downei MFe28]|uniref:Uncharacterized protein n=1 Tax=Streptococcus downei MFe28 TaxID=764290 RepID=A0A380JD22_STRDO|nr:Uncharacterised protein [Streptococcus downei MFe28]